MTRERRRTWDWLQVLAGMIAGVVVIAVFARLLLALPFGSDSVLLSISTSFALLFFLSRWFVRLDRVAPTVRWLYPYGWWSGGGKRN